MQLNKVPVNLKMPSRDSSNKSRRLKILVSRMFDSEAAAFVKDRVVTVSRVTGLIMDVSAIDLNVDYLSDITVDVIDLRASKVGLLPGLIDTHVHLFLHPYAETSWNDQVTKESTAERTIRATTHARNTLMAGYTTVRDLGTEGAEESDLALRKCISTPACIIPGPRLFVATRAIVSTGGYGPKGDLRPDVEGVDGKMGAEAADGEDGCRKAVRRQIGAGADWIKIYADYSFRSRLSGISPKKAAEKLPLFSKSELRVMIDTAHSLGAKVAAHASRDDSVQTLVELGVDSIEHGVFIKEGGLKALQSSQGKTTWNPTLALLSLVGSHPEQRSAAKQLKQSFQAALKMGGITIACGGDTGTFAHGRNALEMAYMIELGVDWRQALKWSTLGGWECIRGTQWEGEEGSERLKRFEDAAARTYHLRDGESETTAFEEIDEWPLGDNDVPLGAIKPGYAADLVAFDRDSWLDWQEGRLGLLAEDDGKKREGSFDMLELRADFVMKNGKVYKINGVELLNVI